MVRLLSCRSSQRKPVTRNSLNWGGVYGCGRVCTVLDREKWYMTGICNFRVSARSTTNLVGFCRAQGGIREGPRKGDRPKVDLTVSPNLEGKSYAHSDSYRWRIDRRGESELWFSFICTSALFATFALLQASELHRTQLSHKVASRKPARSAPTTSLRGAGIVEGEAIVNPENNRFLCGQHSRIFPFDEMLRALESSAAQVRRQDSEALIIAWVNFLRSEVLQLAKRDAEFLSSLKRGDAVIRLRKLLMPEEWREQDFGTQISLRSGLPLESVCSIFRAMSKILIDLNGHRAFEPIGWFEVLPKGEGAGFLVHLWHDFPQPVSSGVEKPREKRVSGSLGREV